MDSDCSRLWKKAARVVPPVKHDEFQKAAMIEINVGHNIKLCYNKDTWTREGWCNVAGSTSTNPMWGIC